MTFSTIGRSVLKWIIRGSLFGVIGIVVALAALPFWMGMAIRALAPEDRIEFESYERVSYRRFTLTNVAIDSPQGAVAIDRVEAYSPLVWILNALQENTSEPFVSVGAVRVDLKESEPTPEPSPGALPENLLEALEMIETPLGLVAYWAPRWTIDSVVARVGDQQVEAKEIDWRERALSLTVTHDRLPEYEWDLVARLNAKELQIRLSSEETDLNIENRLSIADENALLSVRVELKDDLLEATARFGIGGWLPVEATWQASDWSVASDDYGIGGPYSKYEFDLSGNWENGIYRNVVSGKASPKDDDEYGLPPVDFESSFSGDFDRLDFEVFNLSSPGLEARAIEPVGIDLEELRLVGEMRFDIDFDLSLLNIESLDGSLEGEAFLGANEEREPVGRFVLNGYGVSYEDFLAETFALKATLDWPELSIEKVDVVLNSGSMISATGAADLHDRRIAPSSVEVVFSEEILKKFLPEGMNIGAVSAAGKVEGPVDGMTHSGTIEVASLETDALRPISIGLEWSGEGASLKQLELNVRNDVARFDASATVARVEQEIRIQVEAFDLYNDQGPLASLDSPTKATILMSEAITGAIDGFSISGEDARLSLEAEFAYPEKADITVRIKNLNTEEWIDPWLKAPLPRTELSELTLTADWDDGPIEAEARLDATMDLGENELAMNGALSLTDESIRMNAFAVSDLEGPLLKLEGRAPYQLVPSEVGFLVADPDAKIAFSIETSDSPTLIALVESFLPLGVESLTAKANLQGTLGNPQGDLTFSFSTRKGEGEHGVPSSKVSARAAIDGTTLRIGEMVAQVLENRFEASLEIVLPDEALKLAALEEVDVDWLSTQVIFAAPKTSLAPIAFFAPRALAPGGEFEARLSGSPADGFKGFINLEGLNTRPIFPFGSFRNIETRLEFDRTVASLREFKGDIGREPMMMQGEIDFRKIEDLAFEFSVKGENLPIMRQAGLLLRSNLDVVAKKESGKEARIEGDVIVSDGLFLMDTTILTASGGGGQSAESRPPYFSVDVPPFADWELDISVKGDHFMRLQTPAVTGTLSMDMDLKGTLAEPLAIGRVEFENGDLLFPFASFGLTEGLVEIRIDDPYTPILSFLGETRRFKYDLGIEITGSAFDPQIRFASSPPLSSEQILLMVMAGDIPDANFSYSSSQRASKIGSYLSQGLLSSGGESGLGSRFSLVTGQNLSEQGKETLEMEFKLDERFQLLGEYDEYDAWNTGLRWRILRRKPKAVEGEKEDSE